MTTIEELDDIAESLGKCSIHDAGSTFAALMLVASVIAAAGVVIANELKTANMRPNP